MNTCGGDGICDVIGEAICSIGAWKELESNSGESLGD